MAASAEWNIYNSKQPFPLEFNWTEAHVGKEIAEMAVAELGGTWDRRDLENAREDYQDRAYQELAEAIHPILKQLGEAYLAKKQEVECTVNIQAQKWFRTKASKSEESICARLLERGCQIKASPSKTLGQFCFTWNSDFVKWWADVGEKVVYTCSMTVGLEKVKMDQFTADQKAGSACKSTH